MQADVHHVMVVVNICLAMEIAQEMVTMRVEIAKGILFQNHHILMA